VHFLLHRDFEHVQQSGLRIDSVAGDFVLPQVQAYRQTQDMPPVDVVIVGLKTTQNAILLPTLLAPLLRPGTVIVTLQNGLDIEPEIAAISPQSPILGGLCFICSNKVGPGHIHHLDYGSVLLGQYTPDRRPGGSSPELVLVVRDFAAAGIQVDMTPDLYMARWRKLVWNIPFNSLSVILNATTTEMMDNSNARQLAADIMAEVLTAAHACGQTLAPDCDRTLPPDIIDTMLTHTACMKPYSTSMKIDYDEGRPLEVEAIVGNPLRAAQAVGVTIPRIEMLYHQLKMLDQRQQEALERQDETPLG
jgi:2-dehydropantoate 2-reductase